MAIDLSKTLVIGISATALFDLSADNDMYQEKLQQDPDSAMKEFRRYLRGNEDKPLDDGAGMPLVKSILALNEHKKANDDGPVVEIVVVSRNAPEVGYRVLKEIKKRGLNISRSAFTSGESISDYLDAYYIDLFLTTDTQEAKRVMDNNQCATALVYAPKKTLAQSTLPQLRFAFDGDAGIFNAITGDQTETSINPGPHANLLIKLSKVQERISESLDHSPLRVALITSQNSSSDPAEMTMIDTLKHWGIYINDIFFLGGLQKSRFLKAFKPHIFFDSHDSQQDAAEFDMPYAKVMYTNQAETSSIEKKAGEAEALEEVKKSETPKAEAKDTVEKKPTVVVEEDDDEDEDDEKLTTEEKKKEGKELGVSLDECLSPAPPEDLSNLLNKFIRKKPADAE
ncbi:5'-nucleotidase [Budviciaceae bacterium BWR-B9]|uniref:5'-nucleotidase n=1 Tax=Limnobaculum allomyrinae TaxID=2791986 RepID=A0ABS1ILY0_9GAMM|nr:MULTISPECIES: 5'-nucleotidase [Limnobaculum]MBK5142546.1 5'-nucleotidase [Limnobaculum allomyrinae]MBV7690569.1 5'-nucleotidase [Limnobaculum sp. M2-1]